MRSGKRAAAIAETDGEQMAARLQPRGNGARVGRQLRSAARTHNQHLFRGRLAALVRFEGRARPFEMRPAGRIADLKCLAARRRFVCDNPLDYLPRQQRRRSIRYNRAKSRGFRRRCNHIAGMLPRARAVWHLR